MELLIYPKLTAAQAEQCKKRCATGERAAVEEEAAVADWVLDTAYDQLRDGQCPDFAELYRGALPALVVGRGRVVADRVELEEEYAQLQEQLREAVRTHNEEVADGSLPGDSKLRFCLKKGAGFSTLTKGVEVGDRSLSGREKRWSKVDPERQSTRRKMPASCFLKRGPRGTRKYPVCPTGSTKPSCGGTLAAFNRARQQGDTAVAKKALRLAKKQKCPWFKTGKKAQELARKWKI